MNHTQRQGAGNFGICLGASPPFLSFSLTLSFFCFFPFSSLTFHLSIPLVPFSFPCFPSLLVIPFALPPSLFFSLHDSSLRYQFSFPSPFFLSIFLFFLPLSSFLSPSFHSAFVIRPLLFSLLPLYLCFASSFPFPSSLCQFHLLFVPTSLPFIQSLHSPFPFFLPSACLSLLLPPLSSLFHYTSCCVGLVVICLSVVPCLSWPGLSAAREAASINSQTQ